ncbi:(d)CMP kinase [Thiohalorhabdus sp.]|uniref:(d)CMP kinase n=1 Tax=Thiohalorhabdus sp. TaxID=3094134 RepID=UPI002FC36BF3
MAEGDPPPVVTIDGPSGTGKGTVATLLARELGWHYLDSGALYRAVGWAAVQGDIPLEPIRAEDLSDLARNLAVRFEPTGEGPVRVFVDDWEVTAELRSGKISEAASRVAAMQPVRDGLLELQHNFRQEPGLVADGRDMGTVVFPDTPAKLFLTATPEERARRRYEQLRDQGVDVMFERIKAELGDRDERDAKRNAAPLRPSEGAYVIDTTDISIEEVLAQAHSWVRQRLPERFPD